MLWWPLTPDLCECVCAFNDCAERLSTSPSLKRQRPGQDHKHQQEYSSKLLVREMSTDESSPMVKRCRNGWGPHRVSLERIHDAMSPKVVECSPVGTYLFGRLSTFDGPDPFQVRVNPNPALIKRVHPELHPQRCISRHHAKIVHGPAMTKFEQGGVCIIDLDSKSGTFLNGKKIAKHTMTRLQHNDVVSFGKPTFQVEYRVRCMSHLGAGTTC